MRLSRLTWLQRSLGAAAIAICVGQITAPALAQWRPAGITPSSVSSSDVLAANACASGAADPRLAQRRERWTYVTATQRIGVDVAVRNDDFRTTLQLDGLTYTAGRIGGARWRGDGNGIVHGVQADLQGDALDRAPQAVFRLDPASCTLAGEAHLPRPAWVVATARDGDKPAFLYVDEATGTIVREVMRDGRRTVTTTFDRFEPLDGALLARHWNVTDGIAADRLDVTVDTIEPGPVDTAALAFPGRRTFAPATPLAQSVDLHAVFDRENIKLPVTIGATRHLFDLDTGTTSITVAPKLSDGWGGTTLEHAVVPRLDVGPLTLDRVSVLSIPPFDLDGILGLDFFFGHVIEIDYLRQRVRVLSDADAQRVFADSKTAIVPADVDQGMPLVPAAFDGAPGAAFAVDTGSPRPYVMRAFAEQNAGVIAKNWTKLGLPYSETYLEGSIEVQPYRVSRFAFANARLTDLLVGAQVPSKRTDDLEIPFDGIIGTNILSQFDLYVDYDNARLGVRHE